MSRHKQLRYVVIEKTTGREIEAFQFMSVAEAHIVFSDDPGLYEIVIQEVTEPYSDKKR